MSLLIRLTGSESEIAYTLAALKAQGYEWEGENKRYPQRDDPRRFSCHLNDVIVPLLIPAAPAVAAQDNNEPQPRPWDAVLGGKDKGE